jgi:hypothetical protein
VRDEYKANIPTVIEAPRANECYAVGEKTSSPPGDDIKENVYPDPIYGGFGEIDRVPAYWANRALIAPWARCYVIQADAWFPRCQASLFASYIS